MRLLLLDWPSCGFAGYFMVASGGIMGGIEGWGGGGEFSGVGTKIGANVGERSYGIYCMSPDHKTETQIVPVK